MGHVNPATWNPSFCQIAGGIVMFHYISKTVMYGVPYVSCGIALDIITRQVSVHLAYQVSLHIPVICIVPPHEG